MLSAVAAAAAAAVSPRAQCIVDPGVECKKPNHYDEFDAATQGECCDMCSADAQCVFWSFKASDVPNKIACRVFNGVPTQNASRGSFVSGRPSGAPAPPPGPPVPPPPPPATCGPVIQGMEIKIPDHYTETGASDAGGCCTNCGNDFPRCRFWSFKASDVGTGKSCRQFDKMPIYNKSESNFVSGGAPPPPSGSSWPPFPPTPHPPPPAPPTPEPQLPPATPLPAYPPLGGTKRLRVEGSRLIDPDGNKIRLTGFNWVPGNGHYGSGNDGALMKQHLPGANSARQVSVTWHNSDNGISDAADCATETAPYWKDSCFPLIDATIKSATDAGVWVVLAGRSKYGAGQNYETNPAENFFHNDTLRQQFYAMWRYVAARYATWDYIAAYEVMAEPRDKKISAATLRDFYTDACAAVQSVDAPTPCMVGSRSYYKLFTFNDPGMIITANKNVIYTFDYFVPQDFVFGRFGTPEYNKEYPCELLNMGWAKVTDEAPVNACPGGAMQNTMFDADWSRTNMFKYVLPIREKYDVPVVLNQWNVVHGVTEAQGRFAYMADLTKLLQELDIGWWYWVWRGGGDEGWKHGSAEIVYDYANGTVGFDQKAIAAIAPYMSP